MDQQGKLGKSWYVDETYIKVKGEWCYLYRAIDRDGTLIDCRMSKQRDMNAAKAFFQSALEASSEAPDHVTSLSANLLINVKGDRGFKRLTSLIAAWTCVIITS